MPMQISISNAIGGGGGSQGGGSTPSFTNTLSTLFDGVDDSVSLVSDISLGTTSSVSFWIKRNDTAIAQPLGHTTAWSDRLVRLQTTKIEFGSVPFIFNNATTLLTVNQTSAWTHLLFVRTGATCNLYVNGVNNDGAKTNSNASWINKFRVIGAPGDGTTWAFNGLIDEVSLFTTALSSSDATAIYNSGTPTDLTSYSPLGWWRMGDGSTYPTINDVGSGGNNGTMNNMAASNFVTDVPPSPFQSLYSYDFDGVDDTFAIQSASAYAFTGDFTIMAWVNVDAIGNNHYIIDTSTSASFGNGYSFRVRTDGKIRFWSYHASQTGLNSATALSAGSWYHIACVHTSTQNKIYINGSLDATLNWSTGHSTSNTTNLKIASSNVLSGFTEGHIDEVAFFNNDQSANISAIGSTIPTDLSSYSPLGWFRMGDNSPVWNGSTWTMTSVGSQTNTAISANMLEASRTTDVPT